jgi:hypothetical protein
MDIYSIIDNSSHFSVLLSGLFLFLAFSMLSRLPCCSYADATRLSSELFVFLHDEKVCRSTAETLDPSLAHGG